MKDFLKATSSNMDFMDIELHSKTVVSLDYVCRKVIGLDQILVHYYAFDDYIN